MARSLEKTDLTEAVTTLSRLLDAVERAELTVEGPEAERALWGLCGLLGGLKELASEIEPLDE